MDLASIQNLVAEYGTWIYVGIFVWTFFEGETFVIFMGMAAHHGLLSWTAVFFCAWIGSFCGDQCWFWIGRRWGPLLLERYPRWQPGVESALDLLKRYDTWFILSFRFIYGVRNIASFAMGTSGVHPLRFALLNFSAALVWALSFAGFGYVFGKALERMIGDIVLAFGLTMLTMFALVIVGSVIARRRRQSPRTPPGVANETRSS
ncbi:MAG: DedA family protein [Alphaproteobacteria bacterium]|nr:DedA family protein [Alphaproteobacteria bacterium]